MTVSPITNLATLSSRKLNSISVGYELVRGNEDRIDAELLPQVQQGSVALDLSQVERIDAAGIASLITLYCTAIEAGNEFYVVAPSDRVLELLRLVGLESILISDQGSGQVSDQFSDQVSGQAAGNGSESQHTQKASLRFTRTAA